MQRCSGRGVMADEVLLYAKEDGIGFITINRPEARNPLNLSVFRALDKTLDLIAADAGVKAAVIMGAGGTFVSGADINELLALNLQGGWAASRFQQSVFTKIERLGKPSIAAINGFSVGGGLELALSCAFRVASTKARLGFPELNLGIVTAMGGTARLVRAVGCAKASELFFSRALLNGEEASAIGLVHKAVEPDQLMAKVKELAHDLASLSPVAMRLELELFLNTAGRGFAEGLALESAIAPMAVGSAETKRLLEAFLKSRKSKQMHSDKLPEGNDVVRTDHL